MKNPHTSVAGAGPLVWLLQGPKAGDNGQLEAAAAALAQRRPCRVQRVPLTFATHELAVNLLLGVSLAGLTAAARSRIEGPWPDLLLTAGRRNEPVARWIQRASGMRTRLAHFGRPWADPHRFDLVVTTPQYFLDPRRFHNLLTLPLPPIIEAAPAPRDGTLLLLMGGDSGSKHVSAEFAADTVDAAARLAQRDGRALRVTTSPRTPVTAEDAARRRAEAVEADFFGWHERRGAGNPYAQWLAEAGACVVTEDSISMVAEAAQGGRTLWIARLPRAQRPWWRTRRGWTWRSATHELAQIVAPRRFRRDTRRQLDALVAAGGARWLDASADAPESGAKATAGAVPAATVVAQRLDALLGR